jgi:hypothetical protein
MRVLKFKQVELAKDLLNYISDNSILETNFSMPENTFLDKLAIHKLLIDQNKDKLSLFNELTKELVKNSSLNIGKYLAKPITKESDKTSYEIIIMLFCVAAFAVNELDNANFLIDNQIIKSEFELEIKSVLTELKLLGVGNNLVKKLSQIFNTIAKLNKPLETILSYVKTNKISLTEFDGMSDYLDKNLSKLSKNSQDVKSDKVLTINEFNS